MLAIAAVVLLASMASAIDVVPHVNTTAYLGRWYQMYSDAIVSDWFERGAVCVTADYGIYGANNLSVYNSQLQKTVDGPQHFIQGYAFRPDVNVDAKLEVHFFGHVDGQYWIVDIGPTNFTGDTACAPCYDYSVVTDSHQVTLFVLARDPAQFKNVYEAKVLAALKAQGFTSSYNTPKATLQTPECHYPPRPKF